MTGLWFSVLLSLVAPPMAEANAAFRGTEAEFLCMAEIFAAESSWRPDVIGDEGKSFGLGQRHAPVHGEPPYDWPVRKQVKWFSRYAEERYGGWCEAAAARRGKGWW